VKQQSLTDLLTDVHCATSSVMQWVVS